MKKWLAISVVWLSACGAEVERSSEVKTLRVLGVHKTKPYARAGDEVTFSMLWHDPEERDIEPVWFVGSFGDALLPLCVNPPRDNYFGCLTLHRLIFSGQIGTDNLPAPLPFEPKLQTVSQRGNSITVQVPKATIGVPLAVAGATFEALVPSPLSCSELQQPTADDTSGQGAGEGQGSDAQAPSLSCNDVYHAAPDAENLPEFGSVFLFFALCPGELGYDASLTEGLSGFGITCADEHGELYGPDDFVFGYSQIFLYENIENMNPVIEGMLVDGQEADACVGTECVEETGERPEECSAGVVCLDVCSERNEDDCPEISVKPVIPEAANREPDEVAQIAYGRDDQEEQMWIRYYTDRGRMESEVKLLNDATIGWNADFGNRLRLPQEEGPVRLWAVVYDSRGGQNWVRVDAVVQ